MSFILRRGSLRGGKYRGADGVTASFVSVCARVCVCVREKGARQGCRGRHGEVLCVSGCDPPCFGHRV